MSAAKNVKQEPSEQLTPRKLAQQAPQIGDLEGEYDWTEQKGNYHRG